MQGTALRSQLRTNVPGHTAIVGEVTFSSGVPAVGAGTRFTVGRGVLSLTLASSPTIVGAPDGTYTNVPVTTASGSTALCSLTTASAVVTAATVTAPGYDYTAAAVMSVAVGSLFWTAGSLLTGLTGLVAGTYYVPLAIGSGTGMVAKVVTSTTAITAVTVNKALDSATAVGVNYGTTTLSVDLPANALYQGSPAIGTSGAAVPGPAAFTLAPSPALTVGTITTVITGNCSVVFANKVQSVIAAVATPMVAQAGNTFFTVSKRFDGPAYVNFSTLNASNASATPTTGDGFGFEIVATDTTVTA